MRARILDFLDRELPQRGWLRAVVPAIGLAGLGCMAVLYQSAPHLYFRILTLFFDNPFAFPFVDLQAIAAAVDCSQRGVDVYLANPCHVVPGPFNYSPLFLKATFLPTDRAWTNWLGLGLDTLFLLSLGLLPRPRRWGDLLFLVLACFSSLTVFALERGNMDLLMFLLAIGMGVSLEYPFPRRVLGYAAVLLAGLLKFYPLVLLLLTLRERFARFVALVLAAVMVIAWFAAHYHAELARTAANLPRAWYFADNFGAQQLAGGLTEVLPAFLNAFGVHDGATRAAVTSPNIIAGVFLLCIAAAIAGSATMTRSLKFRLALATLGPREGNFLVIGAALIAGCFFAGENVGYRGVHLLFVLPAMLALGWPRDAVTQWRPFRWTALIVMFNLWWLTVQHVFRAMDHLVRPLGGPSFAYYVGWLLHEAAWWWMITVFLAVLLQFALHSSVCRATLRTLRLQQVGTV